MLNTGRYVKSVERPYPATGIRRQPLDEVGTTYLSLLGPRNDRPATWATTAGTYSARRGSRRARSQKPVVSGIVPGSQRKRKKVTTAAKVHCGYLSSTSVSGSSIGARRTDRMPGVADSRRTGMRMMVAIAMVYQIEQGVHDDQSLRVTNLRPPAPSARFGFCLYPISGGVEPHPSVHNCVSVPRKDMIEHSQMTWWIYDGFKIWYSGERSDQKLPDGGHFS